MERGALARWGGVTPRGGLKPLPRQQPSPALRFGARRRAQTAVQALGPDHLDAMATSLTHMLALDVEQGLAAVKHLMTMAYEPIVLPCSALNCGDLTHRSSLDPVLRMEQRGINPTTFGLLAAALVYMFIKPGVLPGAIDYYITARLQRLRAKAYAKEDFILGKKLASGGFGTVYKGELVDPETGESKAVVVKKAKEFGEAEVWMNERMARAAPDAVAEFITAFSDSDGKEGDPLWLVWGYEGDFTLAELLQKKDFPANMEPLIFGRGLNIPPGPERKAAVLRIVVEQLLECLQECHAAGIVHRDVKPQNVIFSNDGRIKLIDLGAAADLRIGINYVPNQYLLDPRYAPPQQYIMSKYTPRAPSKPLAALLSPVLWNLFHPDRFDMYSVGITLMQLAFPNLRNDNALIAFNKTLAEQYNYDLRKWRRAVQKKGGKDWAEGFAVLDCDGGAGWDLVCNLVTLNPSDRLSCAAALAHPWLAPSRLGLVAASFQQSVGSMGERVAVEASWLEQRLSPSGTAKVGGFTEAQLFDEDLFPGGGDGESAEPAPPIPQGLSQTIAWWQGRNNYLQNKAKQRKAALSAAGNGNGSGGGNGKAAAREEEKEKEAVAVGAGRAVQPGRRFQFKTLRNLLSGARQ